MYTAVLQNERRKEITKMEVKELEKFLKIIFKLIGYGLYEIRKLKKLLFLMFLTIVGICIFHIFWKIWWFGFIASFLIVISIGYIRYAEIEKFYKIFYDIGFLGKDKKAPFHIKTKRDGEKIIYSFKSNISINLWEKKKSDIQTSMDCKIVYIEQDKNSKKIVNIATVPSNYKLPTILPWKQEYLDIKESVIVVGESLKGQVSFDFNSTPHWILAGSTGSGKSVLLRSIVGQTLIKKHKVYLMDFKRGVEFGTAYDEFCEVIMTKERAVELLEYLVEENKRRLDIFRKLAIKDIRDYAKLEQKNEDMCRIVTFIDELAILLIPSGGKEDKELSLRAEAALSEIAILGRAAGINLVFGIQRPDAKTVTGQIKSNVSGRICGYFSDRAPSEIVLGNSSACEIDGNIKGRFIFQDGNYTEEMQAYWQSEENIINSIVNAKISYNENSKKTETINMADKKNNQINKDNAKNNTDEKYDFNF